MLKLDCRLAFSGKPYRAADLDMLTAFIVVSTAAGRCGHAKMQNQNSAREKDAQR